MNIKLTFGHLPKWSGLVRKHQGRKLCFFTSWFLQGGERRRSVRGITKATWFYKSAVLPYTQRQPHANLHNTCTRFSCNAAAIFNPPAFFNANLYVLMNMTRSTGCLFSFARPWVQPYQMGHNVTLLPLPPVVQVIGLVPHWRVYISLSQPRESLARLTPVETT